MDTPLRMPYLTADLPGVGGVIKRFDEDFAVEELPLYPTSGDGTHVYFTVKKQGLTTHAAIRLIAQTLGKKANDIGYAGLKDAHGITRQRFSVEHVEPRRVESLDLARIEVLSVDRHTNKIKLGHLAGNRFTIKIRDTATSPTRGAGCPPLREASRVSPRDGAHDRSPPSSPSDALRLATPIFERLIGRGVPNYFGPQRFGARGDNARIGLAVLRDDYEEAIALLLGRPGEFDRGDVRLARELFDAGDLEAARRAWPRAFAQQARVCRTLMSADGDAQKAWRAVDHTLRKFYVCALQSELFNRVVTRRIDTIDRLQTGDIAFKHRNGASFRVEDAAVEQPRCDAFEISPTGPLFGRKMAAPSGAPGELEAQVFGESGLRIEQMRARDGTKLDGARRPLRVPLADPAIDAGKDDRGFYLRVTFTLPPGAYATAVTREICKTADEHHPK